MPFFWLIPIIGLFFHVAFLFYLRSARRLLDGRSPGYEGEVPPMKPGSLRSLLLFAASVMAAGWLLVGAGYLCTDALYLFPALRFPPEVSDTLGLSYHDFRRPVRVICRSGEEGGTSPSVTDDPCVARELCWRFGRSDRPASPVEPAARAAGGRRRQVLHAGDALPFSNGSHRSAAGGLALHPGEQHLLRTPPGSVGTLGSVPLLRLSGVRLTAAPQSDRLLGGG